MIQQDIVSLQTSMLFLYHNGYNFKKILDIGCNIGNWTKQMQQYFPSAQYFMIDATDYPARDKNVPFLQAILSSENGEVDWYDITGGNGTGNSYLKENTAHYANTMPVKRKCITVNSLIDNKLLPSDFQFVKMDVQGAEIDVLKGASKLIENVEVFLLEMPFVGEFNKNAPKFLDYINFMDNIGFVCFDITEIHRHYGMLLGVDILFIRKTSALSDKIQNTIGRFGTF